MLIILVFDFYLYDACVLYYKRFCKPKKHKCTDLRVNEGQFECRCVWLSLWSARDQPLSRQVNKKRLRPRLCT